MDQPTIAYVIGDASAPPYDGAAVIVHICNDLGKWGRGFVLAISRRYPEAERAYRDWYAGKTDLEFGLGQVQFLLVAPNLWVANLIGQHGIRSSRNAVPVRYDAIRKGLQCVGEFAREHHASVHMPRIGCGLAGGTWEAIEPIIQDELIGSNLAVTVYDFAG